MKDYERGGLKDCRLVQRLFALCRQAVKLNSRLRFGES